MFKLLLALLGAIGLSAQTRVASQQLGCPATVAAVYMMVPTGPATFTTICVPLDATLQIVGGKLTVVLPVNADVIGETPAGTIDGANATFTLANAPLSGTLRLFRNGIRQKPGLDYSVSNATVTFSLGVPQTGDILLADYKR